MNMKGRVYLKYPNGRFFRSIPFYTETQMHENMNHFKILYIAALLKEYYFLSVIFED